MQKDSLAKRIRAVAKWQKIGGGNGTFERSIAGKRKLGRRSHL